MSEFINNREKRQEELKKLIKRLHEGASVEEVKEDFAILTEGVTAVEITEMEQALVNEGMPVEEIQRLCDVHASVFKGSIEDIHKEKEKVIPDFEEGHPIHTFKRENRALERLIDNQILPYLSDYMEGGLPKQKELLKDALEKLGSIDRHYSRKENLVFPFMEKYAITAPPQVMWGVDDEIRAKLRKVREMLEKSGTPFKDINDSLREVVENIREMIFKEEEIMFPMVLEVFTEDEWKEIENSSADIGYTLVEAVKRWQPGRKVSIEVKEADLSSQRGEITFDAGSLMPAEINAILNTLPIDMTFVGADDRVKYFSQGKERIFDRPKTILGREVKNCHPPKSVHIVEQIVKDFKDGKKDHEDFWIRLGDFFVYIRYFAVRSPEGEYLGTLEITQDIKPIQELEGEKRLMS